VVATCSVKTEQLARNTEKLLNAAKSMVEGMEDGRSAATRVAGQSIGVAAGEPRTEVLQAGVLRSVGGYGGSTSTAKPGVHASSREPLGEEEHASESGPVRRWIELQLR
jgi:hypothetical protein